MDVHVPFPVVAGLRLRRVDVLTSQEDGTTRLTDSDLLDRCNVLGRVLFTQDRDFLREAAARQRAGVTFAGIVYVRQQRLTIGKIINDLELIALASDPIDVANKVIHLPL
jgi:hypothetical protein